MVEADPAQSSGFQCGKKELWNVGRHRDCRERRRSGGTISAVHSVSSAHSHHQDTQHIVLDVANHPKVSDPVTP